MKYNCFYQVVLRVWVESGANSVPPRTEDAGLCLHSVYRCNNCHNGSALQSAGETGAEESGVGASPARPNGQRRKVKRSFVGDRSSEFSRGLPPRPKRRRAKRGRSTRRAKTHSCLHRSKLGARKEGSSKSDSIKLMNAIERKETAQWVTHKMKH